MDTICDIHLFGKLVKRKLEEEIMTHHSNRIETVSLLPFLGGTQVFVDSNRINLRNYL